LYGFVDGCSAKSGPDLIDLISWDSIDPIANRIDDGDVNDRLGQLGRGSQQVVVAVEAAPIDATVEASANLVELSRVRSPITERFRAVRFVPGWLQEVHLASVPGRPAVVIGDPAAAFWVARRRSAVHRELVQHVPSGAPKLLS
jgi:hypothetical protein